MNCCITAMPYQAGCVSIAGRGLLIEGPPGSGKSSLTLALLDRGAKLVGDDGVILELRDKRLWAMPSPAIAGMLEIRNLGITMYPCEAAPVCLSIRLDDSAPRYVEQAEQTIIAGQTVPLIRLWPRSPVLHLRAEMALEMYGIA